MPLPRLYTLDVRAIVGDIGETVPDTLVCPVCGRTAGHYRKVELVLMAWPECDLVGSSSGECFVSERLLMELQRVGASGFSDWPATVSLSDEFERRHAALEGSRVSMQRYRHLVVTGRCDGPWIENVRGRPCRHCKRQVPGPVDFSGSIHRLVEGVAVGPRLVYTDSWHGEDFFELSEPGLTIITERIAEVLDRTGNLRTEAVEEREMAKRFLPKCAERLERMGWEVPVCASLGPVDWVERS